MILRNMNARHSGVTDWGLSHLTIPQDGAILDAGCGGGRTIGKLVAASGEGTVYGLDHSADSVRVAMKTNADTVRAGRVEIREGSISQLPWPDDSFDLVTAVETHFFWPDLPGDLREVRRVVKPQGRFAIIAEVYKGSQAPMSRAVEANAHKISMTLLTPEEHQQLLEGAGFADVHVFTDPQKGWLCATGRKL
jgi:ubiquinone/menaquinone biosynthesis C-methylase UbiE